MNEQTGSDIALEVLLELRARIAPELPQELVRGCFHVQKNNQFTSDISIPVTEMEKLIEAEVEKFSAEMEKSQ